MQKILHLVPPDAKFAPHITRQFLDDEYRHEFWTIDEGDPKHYSSDERLTCVPHAAEHDPQVIIKEYDAIIAHSMIAAHARVVCKLPQGFPIGWMLFGHEYHGKIGEFVQHTLSTESLRFLKKLPINNRIQYIKRTALGGRLNVWVDRIRGRESEETLIRNSLQRVRIAGFPIREEFEMVRDKLNLTAEFQWFCTVSIAKSERCDDLAGSMPSIVLGNSSTLQNNHVDIIKVLQERRDQFEHCFVPLSYGNPDYARQLCEFSQTKLGKQFVPWIEFQKPAVYQKQIRSCQIGIMNHYRQQGVGTSLMLLAQGTRLFLNERSSVFECFKRMGFHVSGIQQDLLDCDIPKLVPLALEQQLENQSLVDKLFGPAAIEKSSTQFVRKLLSQA